MSDSSSEPDTRTVGNVIDMCTAALSLLKTEKEREAVVGFLLQAHPPAGLNKLMARMPKGTSNASVSFTPPADSKAMPKTQKEKKGEKKKGKVPPPKPVAWAKDPRFVALKERQSEAAAALVARKRAQGADLPADDQLVIDFNSARTAVKNFRP